jgi:hypothetical protein
MNETKGAAGYSLRPTFGALSIVLAVVAIYFVLALFGGIPGGFLPPSFGGQVPSNTPQPKQDTPVQVTVTPSATKAPPSQTQTPTVTNTPTITPTPTLIPRPWTQEQFDQFMFERGYGYGLLLSGWYLYDGNDLLDDFPCLNDCNYENYQLSREVVQEAFAKNNDANFWCEWACEGVNNHFPSMSLTRGGNFYAFKEGLGNTDEEPYCPQFTGEVVNLTCNIQATPLNAPLESYGWSDGIRQDIINKYFNTIVNDGWNWYPRAVDRNSVYWTPDDRINTKTIPDSLICWVIANGHYYFGFPSYKPSAELRKNDSLFHERRLELRAKLNAELGMPTDGNPPLCPGFLGMIEPANLP